MTRLPIVKIYFCMSVEGKGLEVSAAPHIREQKENVKTFAPFQDFHRNQIEFLLIESILFFSVVLTSSTYFL